MGKVKAKQRRMRIRQKRKHRGALRAYREAYRKARGKEREAVLEQVSVFFPHLNAKEYLGAKDTE